MIVTQFVNVPVPENRVQEVYELLARPASPPATDDRSNESEPETNEEGFRPGWSLELLDRMYAESSDNMQRILLAIAQRCPNWVTTGEIGDEAGLSSRQVVAALGPFSKRVTGRYKMDGFPFEAREFYAEDRWKYRMSANTSNRIIRLWLDDHPDEK